MSDKLTNEQMPRTVRYISLLSAHRLIEEAHRAGVAGEGYERIKNNATHRSLWLDSNSEYVDRHIPPTPPLLNSANNMTKTINAVRLSDYAKLREFAEEAVNNSAILAEQLTAAQARLANAQGEAVAWMPIETAPFEDVPDNGKWLHWCLLGRFDAHGWVEWVGGMDADMWLSRDDTRACGDCQIPTHWHPLPTEPNIDALRAHMGRK